MTDCCICLESTNRENIYTMSSCSHWTCKTCFQQLQQQAQEDRKSYIRCPMCRSREDISRPSRHARSRPSRQQRHSTPRQQRPLRGYNLPPGRAAIPGAWRRLPPQLFPNPPVLRVEVLERPQTCRRYETAIGQKLRAVYRLCRIQE